MSASSTETLVEQRIRGALPDGFKTTLADSDRIRTLENADTSNIETVVDDWGGQTLTEADLIQYEVQRVMSSFTTPERTIELPATGIEFERILKFASEYKRDNSTPSGTIKNEQRATSDDIVFAFATPEVYEEISGNNQETFEYTGNAAGTTVEIIDDTGLAAAGQSNGATLSLDDDEMLYFTGDYIDLSDGQSAYTKFQWSDIDGEDYGPDPGILSARYSGAHLFVSQGAWIKNTADLDAKAYNGVNSELVPIAFYMASGTKAPSLS